IIDYGYQKWQHHQNLRMSKQELKDEMKNMEGDPKIKQKRKQILDRLKRACFGRLERDPAAVEALDRTTQRGSDMRVAQKQLAAAVAAIVGRAEEKAVASLFRPGGTQGVKGEFSGMNDFEVVAYVVILPAEDRP
ncbi:MAG: EscU/YscU/HrcU family type III secretion system export apparatus switch protein, partial [Planctomycetia bacterium]